MSRGRNNVCGLAGFLTLRAIEMPHRVLEEMANAIVHRGPDDSGYWFDDRLGIGLAHRRLSILDLSPAGHQPMISARGRFVMAFNGEIYNFRMLREELEGEAAAPLWRGHSDTEALLAGFEHWGIEQTIKRAVGMFAFAVCDRALGTLTLGRDRLGEKPLYYGWQRGVFIFGSELNALRAFPGWSGLVDRQALALFMRHNAVPAPWTIYTGISKLLPGSLLTLSAESITASQPAPVAYWDLREVIAHGRSTPWTGSDADAVDRLDALLRQAVSAQMVADVPLGAFLSGGIDSSTIVAMMQSQSSMPVKTFSIGFEEEEFNEAEHAMAVARHLGTDHTEMYVSPGDAQAVIPLLPSIYDEPFADSSQIPTYLVSRLARGHVTVSLSGDAGDELFGGYNRYFLAARLWGRLSKVPVGLRRLSGAAIRLLSPTSWDAIAATVRPMLPQAYRMRLPGDKLHKGAAVLASDSGATLYRSLVSIWDPWEVVLGCSEPETLCLLPLDYPIGLTERMMALDTLTYLPDDILTKVDRAAMSVSLETRVPLLDHRVVEFAWSLPLSLKVRGGQGKWILRQVLDRYVPRALIERPKMGFGVPIDEWLRGPLREWAEELLSERRLKQAGYFRPLPIREKWAEHLNGRRNWQYHLWPVLMFEAWREQYGVR
jgi:asparagine synthase (glutamine-hydrolysing)